MEKIKYFEKEIIFSKEIKMPKGFKPHEIRTDDKILKAFTCPICMELVCEPIFCKNCGKVSCKNCIIAYFQNKNQGYKCIYKCGGNGYREITNMEKEYLDNIKLKCRHNGCNQFINYTDYVDHLNKCKYRLCRCANKSCKVEGYLYIMKDHIKQCEYRQIDCDKCKKKIIFNEKESHLNQDCPETLINCIFCNKKMKRSEYLQNHQSKDAVCLKKLVDKYYKKITEYEKEIKKQKDINDSVKKSLNLNEKRLKEKDREILSLTKLNYSLQKKYDDLKKYTEEFKIFIRDGYNRFNKDNIDDQPLNINLEIKRKEHMVNSYLNTENNFYQRKENQGRTKLFTLSNNYNNIFSERKSVKEMRRYNSESNFNKAEF